jgi:hypothetical protein
MTKQVLRDLQYIEANFTRGQISAAIQEIPERPDPTDLSKMAVAQYRSRRIIAGLSAGVPIAQIARGLGISRTAVTIAVQRHERQQESDARFERIKDWLFTR